jgi:lipopolysaccharide biosynthesis regulator YciM
VENHRDEHWLESSVSLWQLVASILGIVLAGGTTWVVSDRAAENRMTRMEVRQENVISQQRQQDATIEFLRTVAETNRIALGEIKARLDANGRQLELINQALESSRYKRN